MLTVDCFVRRGERGELGIVCLGNWVKGLGDWVKGGGLGKGVGIVF